MAVEIRHGNSFERALDDLAAQRFGLQREFCYCASDHARVVGLSCGSLLGRADWKPIKMVVPFFGADSIWKVPPARATRSRMPSRPRRGESAWTKVDF